MNYLRTRIPLVIALYPNNRILVYNRYLINIFKEFIIWGLDLYFHLNLFDRIHAIISPDNYLPAHILIEWEIGCMEFRVVCEEDTKIGSQLRYSNFPGALLSAFSKTNYPNYKVRCRLWKGIGYSVGNRETNALCELNYVKIKHNIKLKCDISNLNNSSIFVPWVYFQINNSVKIFVGKLALATGSTSREFFLLQNLFLFIHFWNSIAKILLVASIFWPPGEWRQQVWACTSNT